MSLPWAIEELLPHDHPMILIDEVAEDPEKGFYSLIRISEDCLFFETGRGVPSYVGMEYVAQTVGALVGLTARRSDNPVQLGYLLGARTYNASIPYFEAGTQLTTRVSASYEAGNLAKYDGKIYDEGGQTLVETSLTLYSGEIEEIV